MRPIYSLGILLYSIITWLSSVFVPKARIMIKGRRQWRKKILSADFGDSEKIWVHCASLGEFEQGRPVIEMIKKQRPGSSVIVTFFSPSGYEMRKNWEQADLVMYLPADLPNVASKFVSVMNPDIAIFIKYEFWYNYLKELQNRCIPVYLVSGIFRKDQPFFRWWGGWFREILGGFDKLFIQDHESAIQLRKVGLDNFVVCGDTRFDRVSAISKSSADNPVINEFSAGKLIAIAGSSWQPDEEIISKYIFESDRDIKWIFAPHEVNPSNIERLEKLLKGKAIRYSNAEKENLKGAPILIIDNIGLLSSAYRYASIAIIGGGFGRGIHNILEPATWGLPVLFGPNHKKFSEATGLKEAGGAFSFIDYASFRTNMDRLLSDTQFLKRVGNCSLRFVEKNLGATEIIVTGILPKQL